MEKKRKSFKGILGIIIAVVVIFLVFFGGIASYIIDYQWFRELKYTEVFFKKIYTQLKFFVPVLIGLFILVYTFIRSINAHSIKRSGIILSTEEKKLRNKIMVIISVATSFMLSIMFVTQIWYDFLIFINKGTFQLKDPIFSKDISFYIFTLPFLDKIYGFLLGFIIILAIITVGYNLVFGLTAKQPPKEIYEENVTKLYKPKIVYANILEAAYKQLALLGAAFFIVLAFGFYIRIFGLLYTPGGVAYGAGYTDIHVRVTSYYIYTGISILSAGFILYSSIKKQIKFAALGPLLLIAVLVISGLISTVVQNVIVTPNELSKEEKYLQYNIDYTNYAYGLDKVEAKQFDVAQNLTRKDIESNRATINNIPVNDYRPAKDIYNQIQGLKNYYIFNDIDIDRYRINDSYRQVFISARELQQENIPKQTGNTSASWINQYLKYTHGYGVALSPVNEVTSSGQPRLFIKDMPVSSDINIKVEKPQIYFGEKTEGFVVVNTRENEFDYPTSDQNVETVYDGTGGIKLGFFNRILFAIRETNLNFLLSQDISSNSKVLINRDIINRVKKIAPFLIYDEDPYVVISEGKLYWMIDAFTTSNRYPYSEPINEQSSTNYIRNSVKVVIDAYNGSVDFYIADKNDPIINTYANIFKSLFKPLEDMPADLRAHIRYSQTMFDVQSNIYKKYHIKQARELYNKSDIWDISTQIYGSAGETQVVESTYLIMKLPESNQEEFLLMIPYTPQSKTNMISWLAVKNDGEDYGKMVLYRFPSGKTVEGPMQVEGIVSQDVGYSNTMSLLTAGGNAQIMRGNMMVIPVENSLLYVEPVYVRASNATALPELKKVILFYENQVILEDTLEKGLNKLFPLPNENAVPPPQNQPPVNTGNETAQELIKKANDVFTEAQNALKDGNWSLYGDKMTELQDILKRLNGL